MSRIKFLSLSLVTALTIVSGPTFGSTENASVGSNCPHLLSKATEDAISPQPTPYEVWSNILNQIRTDVLNQLDDERDPFMAHGAFHHEDAQRLMDALSVRPVPGQPGYRKPSILGETRKFYHSLFESSKDITDLETEPFQNLANFYQSTIQEKNPTRADLYRALISAELLAHYISKFQPQTESVDRDGKPQTTQDKEQKEDEKKEQKESKEDNEDIQELPANYDPNIKDTDNKSEENGKQQKKFVHITFHGKAEYFKRHSFNTVLRRGENRFRATPMALLSPSVPGPDGLGKKTKIHIPKIRLGEWIPLFVPAGFRPQASMDPNIKIQQTDSGDYLIWSSQQDIEIHMSADDFDPNPVQLEQLKAPIGIREEEWPNKVKSELFPRLEDKSPLEAARLVEAFLRLRYLYSVDKKPQSDPIEVLEGGSFQCDHAAMIMVAILRDKLGIPSRPVGGFRGKDMGALSKLFLPNKEGHAWVEVFHNGRVYIFDPTPKSKDRKQDQTGGESEAPDATKEFDDSLFDPIKGFEDDPSELDRPMREDSVSDKADTDTKKAKDKSQKQDKKSGKPLPDTTQSQADANAEEQTNNQEDITADGDKDSKADKSQLTEEEIEQILEDLTQEFSIGSVSLLEDKAEDRSVAVITERALRVIIKDILAPKWDVGSSRQRLNQVLTDLGRGKSKHYKELLEPAQLALVNSQTSVADALTDISANLRERPLEANYRRLLQIQDRLKAFSLALDPDQKTEQLAKALELIQKIQKAFLALTEVGDQERSIIEKFMRESPPHTRQIFAQKHKLSGLPTDPNLLAAFNSLRNGKETELNLIRLLYPLTEFIQDSTPTPAYMRVRTYEPDSRSKARPQLVAQESLDRAWRGIRGQPEKSLVQNVLEGTLYIPTRRRQVNVPAPGGQMDPKRVTVALYDTSGSMNGQPGDFQAALLAAFVDRAASERSHKVALMGFDSHVHTVRTVVSHDDAYDVIRNHRHVMKNTNGGTSLMEALKQAFGAILDAQSKANEPLASANIILMTDGQDTVDLDQIRKWIVAIDRRTPLKVMFVSINGTNPDLVKLTDDMRTAGARESYYREFLPEDISDWLKKATEVPRIDKIRDYASRRRPSDLPYGLERVFDETSMMVRYVDGTYERSIPNIGYDRWRSMIKQIPFRSFVEQSPMTSAEQKFNHFRLNIENWKVLKDSRTNRVVLEDIMPRIEQLINYPVNQLHIREAESLGFIVSQLKNRPKKEN